MAKDSYWFRHDSTAGRGLRMRKMAHIHGHWGKGVYWDVMEILRDQSTYSFDYDDSSLQMLADLIGCKDIPKFITWMRDCVQLDLLQVKGNKFFSNILRDNMSKWEKQKRNGSQPKSQTEAKPKHKRREEDSIEEEIIEDKNPLPTQIEFLNYCKEVLKEKYMGYEFSLKAKYDAWAENKWKDGNGNKIKNWKTKIKNTIPYLKPEYKLQQSESNLVYKKPTPIDYDGNLQRLLKKANGG